MQRLRRPTPAARARAVAACSPVVPRPHSLLVCVCICASFCVILSPVPSAATQQPQHAAAERKERATISGSAPLRKHPQLIQLAEARAAVSEESAADTPVTPNLLRGHNKKPGWVKFPFTLDEKFNPFVGKAPYNTFRGERVVAIPQPVEKGPGEGIGVFPKKAALLETHSSSGGRGTPSQSHSQSRLRAVLRGGQHMGAGGQAAIPDPSGSGSGSLLQTGSETHSHTRSRSRVGSAHSAALDQSLALALAAAASEGSAGSEGGGPPTWVLPRAPFVDPFTKEEDPILNFNPYNPYSVHGRWVRRNVPPGQGRTFLGPIVPVPPGFPTVLGIPVGPKVLSDAA